MMHTRGQNGFTLLELLIALAIFMTFTVTIYGSFERTFEIRELTMQSQERIHTVRAALQRMSQEISMAFVFDCRELNTPLGDRRQRTLFKVDREGDVDRMMFTSFSHLRMFRDVKESDQNMLSYYGEADPDDSRKMNLMRREKVRIDADPEDGGRALVLCPDIEEMDLELWDETKEDWVEEWDCSQVEQLNRLPRMVRITLKVKDEHEQVVPYTSIARIHMQKPLANWLKPSQ